MRLFTYRITHDTGFAPNPFHGFLTLATCMPDIRLTKKTGDWIAGFASVALRNNANKGVSINTDALIYLGNISKVITIAEYYQDVRYKNKIPVCKNTDDLIACAGDNIYKPLGDHTYKQISNPHHDEDNYDHDVDGKNVLIMDEYFYMGREARLIPRNINISIPIGRTRYGNKTLSVNEINKLINWVKKEFNPGVNAMPCIWDEDLNNKDCDGCK